MIARRSSDAPTGRYIPWLLAGGFAVALSINGVMAYLAVTSNPGLWVEHAYERGLAHNQALKAAAESAGVGWRVLTTVTPGLLSLDLRDGDGGPLDAQSVAGLLRRPVHGGGDLPLDFVRSSAGRWEVVTAALPPGQWELEVTLRHGGDRLHSSHRIRLP